MVEFIKEIVSGKKRRYRHDGLNLDLTYITDRIIAMSFPSTGFESVYRNNIDDVSKLLSSKHGSNYLVLNLSERKYNYEKFGNQVIEFAWEDHHSPPLDLLFQACETIDKFLNKDINNVVVIHCLAGKGRTGTIISCYFLYCGRFDQVKQALKYYKLKRFERGGGVTQPSQIRYVHYFGYVLHGFLYEQKIFNSSVVTIDRIVLYGMPRISVGYFRPYVELYSVRKRKLIYSTKRPDKQIPKYVARDDEQNEKVEILFPTKQPVVLAGDILVKVYHMGALGAKLAFRFGFNTAFLVKGHENQAILPLSIEELDPDSTKVDDRFPPKFYVEVHMTSLQTSTPTPTPTPTPEVKNEIAAGLGSVENRKEENAHWDVVYKILQNYKQPTPKEAAVLLFKDPEREDIEKVLDGKVPPIKESAHVNGTLGDQEQDSSDSDHQDPQEDIKSEIIDPEEAEVEHKEEKEPI